MTWLRPPGGERPPWGTDQSFLPSQGFGPWLLWPAASQKPIQTVREAGVAPPWRAIASPTPLLFHGLSRLRRPVGGPAQHAPGESMGGPAVTHRKPAIDHHMDEALSILGRALISGGTAHLAQVE